MTGVKMKELVDRYLQVRCKRLAAGSREEVKNHLSRLAVEWDRSRRVPNALGEDWMAEFLHAFQQGEVGGRGKPLQVSSYNKSLTHYRGFLRYLIERKIVTPDVLDACVDLAIDGERKTFLRLSMAQIVQMIESCGNPWERWVLAYASQTLGRESELLGRKVGHLHIPRGVLDWYRPKTSRREAQPHDELPLTNEFIMEWQRWAYVYQGQCGSLEPWFPLVPRRRAWGRGARTWAYYPDRPPKAVAHIVQKHAARVAGVDPETLKGQGVHIMRRSMARALYDRLVREEVYEPLTKVQTVLGHATPRNTMIYIGLHPDREARNNLLVGSSLLWVPQDNVKQLKAVGDE